MEVPFQDASAHQTCLCKRIRNGVTLKEDLTYLKKANMESGREGSDIGARPWNLFERDVVDLAPGAIEGTGEVFSQ